MLVWKGCWNLLVHPATRGPYPEPMKWAGLPGHCSAWVDGGEDSCSGGFEGPTSYPTHWPVLLAAADRGKAHGADFRFVFQNGKTTNNPHGNAKTTKETQDLSEDLSVLNPGIGPLGSQSWNLPPSQDLELAPAALSLVVLSRGTELTLCTRGLGGDGVSWDAFCKRGLMRVIFSPAGDRHPHTPPNH